MILYLAFKGSRWKHVQAVWLLKAPNRKLRQKEPQLRWKYLFDLHQGKAPKKLFPALAQERRELINLPPRLTLDID